MAAAESTVLPHPGLPEGKSETTFTHSKVIRAVTQKSCLFGKYEVQLRVGKKEGSEGPRSVKIESYNYGFKQDQMTLTFLIVILNLVWIL